MRSLVLLLSLYAAAVTATDYASLEEKRQRIMAAANAAAAGMGGFEEYAPYIKPFPSRLLKGEELTDYILFAEGWSNIESEGIWSEGEDSRFFVRMEAGTRPEMMYIHGRYHDEEEGTTLLVNGRKISDVPLIHQKIRLPDNLEDGAILEIELHHINPASIPGRFVPGGVVGTRRVKFFLVAIEVW
jgi:hypothetical protein